MRGAKPRNPAFSVCPEYFHKVLQLFEHELKAMGNTKPKTMAEQYMADCFHLGLEAVKDAKRGRGPYARGKPCKAWDCDGKKNCLLHGEVEVKEIFNRNCQLTTKPTH